MFTQEQVKSVAQATNTSKVVFDSLSKRLRYRRQTNLNKFQQILFNQGHSVDDKEFYDTFRNLEGLGIGKLITGRKSGNKFIWNYDLKGIAKMGCNEESGHMTKLQTSETNIIKKNTHTPIHHTSELIDVTFKVPANIKPEALAYVLSLVEGFKRADLKKAI